MLMFLTGCVVAGDFPEKRKRLHELGNDETYCAQNPDKCINGMPW